MSTNSAGNDEVGSDLRPDEPRFFVSYSRQDRKAAEALCRALSKRKIPYWLDERDIDAGAKFSGKIVEAINQSAGVIVLLSEYSNSSEWVEREVGWAASRGKDLFPVRIANVGEPSKELVLHISGRQSVDLTSRPFDTQELDRLVAALRKALRRENAKLESRPPDQPQAQDQSTIPRVPITPPTASERKSRGKLGSFLDRSRKFATSRSTLIKGLAFVAACASAWWVDGRVAENDQASVVAQRLFSMAMHYEYLVTLGPRKPQPSHVFLVEINGIRGVSSRNICQERPFIGDLLRTLALAHPKVVVIDKFFDTDSCEAATDKLLVDGAAELCRADAKIVVGRGVNDNSLENGRPPYSLDPGLDFVKAGAPCVKEGLVNLDPDFRRVVLRFPDVEPVHDSDQAPPSLALAAAIAYRSDLNAATLPATTESRYVSFLTPGQFEKVKRNATDVLCKSPRDGKACDPAQLRKDIADLARGSVVVIGEFDPTDQHETVLGELNGYMLQANYIESLVDNRLIKPVPELADWLAGLAVFVCFEFMCLRLRGLKRLVALGALPIAVWLLVYIAVNNLGYYLNPTLVAALAVLYSQGAAFVPGGK